ncbi:MAG: hypothetical protein ACR2MD_03635 [Aridibacter sp.]
MFEVTDFKIENFEKPLFDIDITQSNSWIGVSGYSEKLNSRDIFEHFFGSHIHFGNKSLDLPTDIRFPIVRGIDENTALVLGGNKQYDEADKINAWIINSEGKVKTEFSTDSAIENVVITKDFIVIGYFDEAACYGEGLEIYNFEGKFLFGYEEFFGKDAVSISDCYATALVEENRIIFCPYTVFPLVLLDIETRTQKVFETPMSAHGFSAISKLDEKVYFHHRYDSEIEGTDFGIYEWEIGSESVQKIGEYKGHFVRGLPNGQFFSMTDSGYSIISLK